MNVLIAGIGYTNLRDLSVGPVLVPVLQRLDWPPGVEIEDLSFGPIAVIQWLQACTESRPQAPRRAQGRLRGGSQSDRPGYHDRVVFLSAVARGREPGRVYCYRWDGTLPDADEVQARIGEAVTGVISLDNLLIIGQYFGVWPEDVVIVEVEPADENWGPGFSPQVADVIPEVIEMARREALAENGKPTKGNADNRCR